MIIDKFLGQQVRYREDAEFKIEFAKISNRNYKIHKIVKGNLHQAIEEFEKYTALHGYAKRLFCKDFYPQCILKFVNQ